MSQPTAADLARVPLFADMPDEMRSTLAERFAVKEYAAGQKVVTEGEHGYAFYAVDQGTLTVSQEARALRTLVPGDFFGEISIIGDGRRTATVTADGPVVVWALFGTSFRVLQSDRPDVAKAIQAAMDHRLATD